MTTKSISIKTLTMEETRILMGMPITVLVVDAHGTQTEINKIFDYFNIIDERFGASIRKRVRYQLSMGGNWPKGMEMKD